MAGRAAGLADRALRQAIRSGASRGLGDGSRAWLVIGAVAVGVRLMQRLARPGQPTVACEELRPGETLLIRHLAAE